MKPLAKRVAGLVEQALLSIKDAEEESVPMMKEMLLKKASRQLLSARDEVVECMRKEKEKKDKEESWI